MENENIRISLNKFLKMYFHSCKEVYEEISFDKITIKQFKYLKDIHSKGEVTLTELSCTSNVSKPTMNEFINKFLNAGIVKKRKSVTDKRVSYISLTDIGVALATTNLLESQRAVKKMMDKLNEEELVTITNIFDKFGDDNLWFLEKQLINTT